MNQSDANLNALDFSPQFWWKSFDRAVLFTEGYARVLVPEFNLKKWLNKGVLEHDSISIHREDCHYLGPEYAKAIKNNYFYRIGAINQLGNKVFAESLDALKAKYYLKDDDNLFYTFRMFDLNHLVSLYLQRWLLFDDSYYWIRWQLYYDFALSKVDKTVGGLFQNMWHIIFVEIDIYPQVFKNVSQYKKFRDKMDELKEASYFIQDRFIEQRNANTDNGPMPII